MIYLAYGSNLMRARLSARTPRARALGTAVLAGHVARFHKRGEDGSGKYDAFFTGNPRDHVHGLLYEMDHREKRILDGIEGAGYSVKSAVVRCPDPIEVFFYVAEPEFIEPGIKPYHWYRDLVLAGALENGFPEDYVSELIATTTQDDPDPDRRRVHAEILAGSPIMGSHRDLFKNTLDR